MKNENNNSRSLKTIIQSIILNCEIGAAAYSFDILQATEVSGGTFLVIYDCKPLPNSGLTRSIRRSSMIDTINRKMPWSYIVGYETSFTPLVLTFNNK